MAANTSWISFLSPINNQLCAYLFKKKKNFYGAKDFSKTIFFHEWLYNFFYQYHCMQSNRRLIVVPKCICFTFFFISLLDSNVETRVFFIASLTNSAKLLFLWIPPKSHVDSFFSLVNQFSFYMNFFHIFSWF